MLPFSIGVSMAPGATALTRTLSGASDPAVFTRRRWRLSTQCRPRSTPAAERQLRGDHHNGTAARRPHRWQSTHQPLPAAYVHNKNLVPVFGQELINSDSERLMPAIVPSP